MLHPSNHIGTLWGVLTLGSAEFFTLRMMPDNPTTSDLMIGIFGAIPFSFVTFIPAGFVVILTAALFGWWDHAEDPVD